ncbi:MAG: hypothetical protein J5892_03475 [Bacilli bacterium]|nr:hypothetical protein [Bacilli bacterium]
MENVNIEEYIKLMEQDSNGKLPFPRFYQPLTVKIDNGKFTLLADDTYDNDCAINDQWPLFNGIHYGFVIIRNVNGYQKDMWYPTENPIQAMGKRNGNLFISERGKAYVWVFDSHGRFKTDPCFELDDESNNDIGIRDINEANLIVENFDSFGPVPIMKNPIKLLIKDTGKESLLLADEDVKKDYPLDSGVMLGTDNFGFVLKIDNSIVHRELYFPTQFRVKGVEMKEEYVKASDRHPTYIIKVYEDGKYFPWKFYASGKLIEAARFTSLKENNIRFIMENSVFEKDKDRYLLKMNQKYFENKDN